MAQITVIGAGYVGLVTGACLADLGSDVACIDIAADRIAGLQRGTIPIFEPGLEELVARNAGAHRLRFTTDYRSGLEGAEFAFIAVDTPMGAAGEADMRHCEAAVRSLARAMTGPLVIVNKSTTPIGAGDWMTGVVSREITSPWPFNVVSNPEFLREGSAVQDFLTPDRVVLGATDRAAAERVAELYGPLGAPVLITDMRTAEMVKYASNAFLATKISFINEIATICEQLGADIKQVAEGMGYDHRIGREFLNAGLGYGGSCFPKDVRALEHMASVHGCHPQLLRAVMDINRDVRRDLIQKIRTALGTLEDRVIGILGLSFKPNTDDLRDAPSLEIIHLLQHEGAHIRAYDPAAIEGARALLSNVTFATDAYELAAGCDALALVTEWNEFRELDLVRTRDAMRTPVFVDGRNIYDPDEMARLGFLYTGMGRQSILAANNGFRPVDTTPARAQRTASAQLPVAADAPRTAPPHSP
ncbi:MAG: nucleotide sugar dehydrogenase [Chloroflexi bacterium]|nr:nucleotide sugar dehydrogenase [Chloroflexota bacterium]